MSLRERNRHHAKRHTQRTALELFEQRGFEAVTVAELAEEVGMAASTIYRHFETKEAIVLWDEHEADFEKALLAALGEHPPWEAMRRSAVNALAHRYDQDLEFQLRRMKFLYRTPAVHGAAVEADHRDREELAKALRLVLPREQREAAPLLAAGALLALEFALDRWQASGAELALGALIDTAFEQLGHLAALGRDERR